MNFKLRNIVAATLAGTALMGFGTSAMADSTFDLVQALVAKGILTEEEALPLLKGRENDIQLADKKVKKAAKLSVSDAVDNATLYGDIRVREEYRSGEDAKGFNEERTRSRYKLTFGAKTEAGDFYSDLAFAMGAGGRSDNATFAGASTSNQTVGAVNGGNNKETLFVKRAMLGWKATDWLTLEAGRIANPLYTTPMVWDGDLTFEGLAEKLTFDVNPQTQVFANLVQSQYLGDYQNFPTGTADRLTNNILAFQGGAKYAINDLTSIKAALTFTKYTNDNATGANTFTPALSTSVSGTGNLGTGITGTNNLKTIEIPAELSYKLSSTSNIGIKLFGDYVVNIDGSDRYDAAVAANPAIKGTGNDDTAWMLGIGVDSKQEKQPKKGDWSAKLWYQDVGVYSVDPNAVDSDFMDSRVNMKGVVLKAEYNVRDNVFVNFAAGHATRKNDLISAIGTGNDLKVNLDSFDLVQLDLTYKF